MTQIVADRRQIDSGLQERNGRAVSHTMRVKPLLVEIGNDLGSTIKAPAENVADSEPRQGFVAVIQKHANF